MADILVKLGAGYYPGGDFYLLSRNATLIKQFASDGFNPDWVSNVTLSDGTHLFAHNNTHYLGGVFLRQYNPSTNQVSHFSGFPKFDGFAYTSGVTHV